MFLATLLDPQHTIRHFSIVHPELDLGVDVINRLICQGNQLIEVAMLEGDKLTQLSIESFDGEPCSDVFQQLITECQQLISRPLNRDRLYRQSQIDSLVARRIQRHGVCIHKLRTVIHSSEQRLNRVLTQSLQAETVNRVELSLIRFRQCLAAEQASLRELFQLSNNKACPLSRA